MTSRGARMVVMVIALIGAGCQITTDTSGGTFKCTDECPPGLSCIEGQCLSGPVTDGAPADSPPDAADCTCEPAMIANDCGAAVVTLDGAGAPGGELFCASTESNSNEVLGCTGQPMPAADAAFRVAATAGQTLTASVRPTGFDASIYITRDCSGTCEVIANDVGVSGTETAMLSPTVAGDYFVVVDSPTGSGCYELTVTLN